MVTGGMAVALHKHLRKHGVLSAAIAHGLDVTMPAKAYQRFVPHVFDSLDMILPVSNATGDACIERGAREDDVVVVPNGIDESRIGEPPGTRRGRRDLLQSLQDPANPLSPNDFVLLSVGRQVRRKGFAWFIDEVMPLLPENVHYWLAGDGPEGEAIRASIDRRNLGHRVRLLGRIPEDDLARLYRGSDLFVMPNIPVPGDMEGFGVVMLEANLGGLPVVASRLEGIQDVIIEGANGHFIESGNAWDFSEEIMRYVYNWDRLDRASERAIRHVRDNFSWNSVAARYSNVIAARAVPEFVPARAALAA
jgi:phosphatidyl-myo-inositol dimannoside synthase